MDGRIKSKGGRPPKQLKQTIDITPSNWGEKPIDIDYNGHIVHIEPHGRVVVSKLGLHVTEFIDIDTDIDLLIEKAKVFINGTIR